ncbi:MAG: chromate efflux transporter [Oligoflexia bacterium]|nr:chromate efflux transporter [Oligoflexia bacterium]
MTSFGGPIAHLGYFHNELVSRRKWIDERAYADLVALCQFIPGPASSQVGIALGLSRASYLGALAAWLGFTLPSFIILTSFAFGISELHGPIHLGYLHGLKVVAVAVVAHAIWGMSVQLCSGKIRATIALSAAILASLISSAITQVLIIFLGAIVGLVFLRNEEQLPQVSFIVNFSKKIGILFLGLFFIILAVLPFIANHFDNPIIKQFDSFYRAGSLVFGGGHVVLPLLKNEIVNSEMVSNEAFMAGYGAAQAIPGPLFTFSAYLGAVSTAFPSKLLGATFCLLAIFLPSFLLIVGVLPFWENLRKYANMKFAISGINASVVGLLISAFYNPVWSSAIYNVKDFSLAIGAFLILVFWKFPPWFVVIFCAIIGGLFL